MEKKYVKITLEQIEKRHYKILTDKKVAGLISLSENAELYFKIEEDFRGKHLAASAVYDFTQMAHKDFHEPIIHAIIDSKNEMAKHVLEHNGYEIISQENDNIIYEHRIYETRTDDNYLVPKGQKVLYLAGGCFWGTEKVFHILKGVSSTITGYANGHIKNPTYEQICRMETGFKETVRVTYNPEITSTEKLLKAYFLCIDPEQENGQKDDIGSQYQTGIYYKDKSLINDISAAVENEKRKHKVFYTKVKELECFYEAEEYHQDYLLKNPAGYCHITKADLEAVKKLND